MGKVGEHILKMMSRSTLSASCDSFDAIAPSDSEAISLLIREYPQLVQWVSGKRVADFGCGFGAQAIGLARLFGASVVRCRHKLGLPHRRKNACAKPRLNKFSSGIF